MLATSIERGLRKQGTAARARAEKAYLKSALVHFGVPVPAIRKHVAASLRMHAVLTHDELCAAVVALWARGIHELRMAAVELLVKRCKLLTSSDVPLVERLLREASTWAFVDVLATHVMGPLVTRDPRLGRTLDRWAKDDNFWIRRSAMLALLAPLRRGDGDFARFGRYADAMLDEREFFIRKAIGWILRETSRKRAELVYDWLAPRVARISGLTLREATRHLPAAQRDRLRVAAARRTPQR